MSVTTKRGVGIGRHPSAGKSAKRKYRIGDTVAAWAFMAPALVMFITFIIVPVLTGAGLSFFTWHFLDTPEWVGMENFQRLVADPAVWKSLGVTFYFLIIGVIPTILIGFMLAVLVNAKLPGIGAVRVLYFVPAVLSVAVSGVLWMFIYDPRQGPIAALFRSLGLEPPNLLQNQMLAVPALVFMMIWLAQPLVILLYLSGLQRVPVDIYDAAALDGASPWKVLWKITWPNVMPTTFVVAVLQIINFASHSLDVAKIMTDGAPLGATQGLALYAYKQAFTFLDAGYASTIALLQLVVIVSLIIVGRFAQRKAARNR